MQRLGEMTQKQFDARRGFFGQVGKATVIKNSRILKDVKIGSRCYIKGANKLKNLTINSSDEEPTQIGEGVEMVNGIIGLGCRVFYGCKAVRFIMGNNTSLKYGARLLHSMLGDNSTVSCCELLNNLIFPAHEQHHNNSFLTSSLLMGQSNIAAGATIGSNHNSRANDGEIQAGRGFWPGLCTTLKHSCRFASFALLVKGDYPAELDVPLPFALLRDDPAGGRLVVMPAYLVAAQYVRPGPKHLEVSSPGQTQNQDPARRVRLPRAGHRRGDDRGDAALGNRHGEGRSAPRGAPRRTVCPTTPWRPRGASFSPVRPSGPPSWKSWAKTWRTSRRKTVLVQVRRGYHAYREMLHAYAMKNLLEYLRQRPEATVAAMAKDLSGPRERRWVNLGGQLVEEREVDRLRADIGEGTIADWPEVHQAYDRLWKAYPKSKQRHALACLLLLCGADDARAETVGRRARGDAADSGVHSRRSLPNAEEGLRQPVSPGDVPQCRGDALDDRHGGRQRFRAAGPRGNRASRPTNRVDEKVSRVARPEGRGWPVTTPFRACHPRLESEPPVESPKFVMVTCQVGAETAVKGEVARLWPDFRFSYSRPGFLTFKLPEGADLAEDFKLRSVFARAHAFSLGKATGTDVDDHGPRGVADRRRSSRCRGSMRGRGTRPRRDTGGSSRRSPRAAIEAKEAIRRACPRPESLSPQDANPLSAAKRGEPVLDCVIVQPGQWWIGYHRARSAASRWPGGMMPLELPPDAVSRAWLKMEEALRWSRLPIPPAARVAEIGSAPGGASQALLARGFQVTGVDPAEMSPIVLGHSRFTHLRRRAVQVRRREFRKIRWLTADMNVAPNYTLDVIEGIVTHPEVRIRGLLLTLKLIEWDLAEQVPEYLARVRGWGYQLVRARQLQHNRQEICVAALRRVSWGTLGRGAARRGATEGPSAPQGSPRRDNPDNPA